MKTTANSKIREALTKAFEVLAPYSDKHKHDFDRYAFSLSLVMSLPDVKDKKVLDVGTGIGIIPLALKNMGISVEGADHNIFPEYEDERFSVATIDNLKAIWSAQSLVVHNIDLNNPKELQSIQPVDVIISEATLEHLKKPKQFFSICKQLLAKDKYLLVSTPNIATLIKRIRFLFGKTTGWPIESFFEEEEFIGHWREYTMDELIYMSEKSGFRIIEHHTRNVLAKFKMRFCTKKNLRALLGFVAAPFPGMCEIHYVLMQKNEDDSLG